MPKSAWRKAYEKGKHFSRTGQIRLTHFGTGIDVKITRTLKGNLAAR